MIEYEYAEYRVMMGKVLVRKALNHLRYLEKNNNLKMREE
jgi:hypothetical protein